MMTTGILDALMQLFAVFAAGRSPKEAMLGRQAANRYLSGRLTRKLTEDYLKHYDQALAVLNKGMEPSFDERILAKRTSKLSVKLLRICSRVHGELELKDRFVVFVRLAELAKTSGTIDVADSFLQTVGDALNLPELDATNLKSLVKAEEATIPPEMCQYFSMALGHSEGKENLIGCRLSLDDLFFIKYIGNQEIRLNGNVLNRHTTVPMAQGSVLKDANGHAIFFSDILRSCSNLADHSVPISLQVDDLAHFFSYPQEPALMPVSLHAKEGELIAIMGASGSGKSTLLNIINGSIAPTFGAVQLNGRSIHNQPDEVAGSIGHIAQEDVLISEISVRDNLRYSAELSLGGWTDQAIDEQVDSTLKRLGLWEIRSLRVGSLMDKTISGGQRKRLNIALELIREPMVLFVDEPTSGLSSRDSEQIMDLLKELTLRGKLIFVVIHQPSSDIFKLFDRLLLLDRGGYPIYQGNPLESLSYFRSLSNHAHSGDSICHQCGTVNPEELFTTIEVCMVDEFGQLTDTRRVQPSEWNDYYNLIQANPAQPMEVEEERPPRTSPPNWRSQWRTYWRRDIHAKRTNKQYLAINFLEAPVLASILAGFTRFQDGGQDYVYRLSENMPQFLFISVIVVLFMGLSVSAEEILRDRPTLRRERFLQLNWSAYLTSKVGLMFMLSAIQSATYALISIAILQIPDAFGILFMTLFSLSCFANMLGLSISSAFKSAKVIYIIIPLLIIPQIIFGGAIVRFDRFNPVFTQVDRVPWIGNLMASRWGFESVVVSLTRNNQADALFIEVEDRLERSAWRRDFWCHSILDNQDSERFAQEKEGAIRELQGWGIAVDPTTSILNMRDTYKDVYRNSFELRDSMRRAISEFIDLTQLKDKHHNDALHSWVMQTDRKERIAETERGLIQGTAFIHQMPGGKQAWNAPFYSPYKQVGSMVFSTSTFNLGVLWSMILLLFLLLANRLPERLGMITK